MQFYLDLAAVFQVFTEFDVDKFGLTLLSQPFLFIIVPHDDMGLSEKNIMVDHFSIGVVVIPLSDTFQAYNQSLSLFRHQIWIYAERGWYFFVHVA